MPHDEELSDSLPAERPDPRRPYRAPALTEHGPISRLTESGGATQNEGSSGRRRMM